jgi:hypothetical protein
MLGLNLGRYVIARFNIVCGTLLFFIVKPILINKTEIVLRELHNTISCGFIKEEKKTFYKKMVQKGRECEGGIVLNGGKNEITMERGKHMLYLIYIKEIFSFLFLFLFLYLKKKRKIGGIGGRGREPVMYYER